LQGRRLTRALYNPKRKTLKQITDHRLQTTDEPMAPDVDEKRLGEKWAYGIMAGFLIGLFLMGLLVFADRRNRATLERITQPTAVGDPITLHYDSKQNPGKEILRWKGEAYFLQTNEPLNLAESDAMKIGMDDSNQIQLYQARNQTDKRLILAKIAPDQFLRLTPR
jgi:hypothetical protein